MDLGRQPLYGTAGILACAAQQFVLAEIRVSFDGGEHLGDEQGLHEKGRVAQGDLIPFFVDVPSEATELRFRLVWDDDWGAYPTDDLDMLVYDPDGNLVLADNDGDGDLDGISFDSPERLSISSPAAGTWTILVNGFTVWEGREIFELYANHIE